MRYFILIVLLIAGCGTKNVSDNEFISREPAEPWDVPAELSTDTADPPQGAFEI